MNQAFSKKGFNPWPYGLVAFFIFFISLMVLFVLFALGQDMQLVRPDYYEAEIRHQEQIDREERTLPFQNEVAITYDALSQTVGLRLPASHVRQGLAGRVQFYRPSDARLDHEVTLSPDTQGRQEMAVGALAAGLWTLHLFWEVDGQEYYAKQTVVKR